MHSRAKSGNMSSADNQVVIIGVDGELAAEWTGKHCSSQAQPVGIECCGRPSLLNECCSLPVKTWQILAET